MRNRLAAAIIAVAVAYAVVLGFGFWIHERTSAIPDRLFGIAAALAIAAIAGGVFCLLTGMRPSWPRRNGTTSPQPAYDERKSTTPAVCVHLQPIEQAIRGAGLKMRWLGRHAYEPAMAAACRINEAELRRVLALPDTIYYREQYQPERSERDNPRADIFCAECLATDPRSSAIGVVHPDECLADTPWFPSPPPAATTSGPASGPDFPATRRR